MKKYMNLLLVLTLLTCTLCNSNITTFAYEQESPFIEEVVEPQVVATWNMNASNCRTAYYAMLNYNSWGDTIALTIGGLFNSAATAGVYALASLVRQSNFNSTKNAFYNGWKSGRGCRMLIYDNATPVVLAN